MVYFFEQVSEDVQTPWTSDVAQPAGTNENLEAFDAAVLAHGAIPDSHTLVAKKVVVVQATETVDTGTPADIIGYITKPKHGEQSDDDARKVKRAKNAAGKHGEQSDAPKKRIDKRPWSRVYRQELKEKKEKEKETEKETRRHHKDRIERLQLHVRSPEYTRQQNSAQKAILSHRIKKIAVEEVESDESVVVDRPAASKPRQKTLPQQKTFPTSIQSDGSADDDTPAVKKPAAKKPAAQKPLPRTPLPTSFTDNGPLSKTRSKSLESEGQCLCLYVV
jgi:hypothetical protein